MKPIILKTAWGAVRQKGSYIQYHSHDYYELVYYNSGYGTTHIGASHYDFAQQQFVLIPPGVEHDEVHPVDGGVFVVGFLTEEELPTVFYTDEEGKLIKVVKDIVEESVTQPPCYKEMLDAKLNELSVLVKRIFQKQSGRFQAKSFEYVINYLAENYHEKIQLKDFAEQLNFSYDYFQHRFKELQGMSPQQFLICKRVEAAAKLLKEENFGCTEVAFRCGFSNSAQFSAIFKREMGVTPGQYRREKAP